MDSFEDSSDKAVLDLSSSDMAFDKDGMELPRLVEDDLPPVKALNESSGITSCKLEIAASHSQTNTKPINTFKLRIKKRLNKIQINYYLCKYTNLSMLLVIKTMYLILIKQNKCKS